MQEGLGLGQAGLHRPAARSALSTWIHHIVSKHTALRPSLAHRA